MKIGILGGTGKQGSSLAKRWSKSGHQILIGSRSEDRGRAFAEENFEKSSVSGGDNKYACNADVVVLAVPYNGIMELLAPLKSILDGKIILDLTVPLKPGKFLGLYDTRGGSAYQTLREFFNESLVVACLKTISSEILASNLPLDQADFIMGQDDKAVEVAFQLSSDLGLQPVRIRGLFHAHTIERMVPLAIQINKVFPGSHIGYKLSGLNVSELKE